MEINYEIYTTPQEVKLHIERGILGLRGIERLQGLSNRIAIITDDEVGPFHAIPLCQKLEKRGVFCKLFSFSPGERNKSRSVKEKLEDQLQETGFGRDSALIAVGGGVVTDLGGFIASTYCRGIPFVLIPTSLLAMVDACIGGKTGVNMPKNKNFIGTICQPREILIDTNVLETQPMETYRDGLVEMIKHGLIWDAKIFEWMEENVDKIIRKEQETLEKGVIDSCRVKLEVVLEDALESGMRRLLNFGHTIGHALESLSNYQISHGTSVAIGCMVEGYLSDLTMTDLKRMGALFERAGIIIDKKCINFSSGEIYDMMISDKKALSGIPRFVTLKRIGEADSHQGSYCTSFKKEEIIQALEWMQNDMYQLARS